MGDICCLSFLSTDLSLEYKETERNMLLSISQLRTGEKYIVGLNPVLRDCIKEAIQNYLILPDQHLPSLQAWHLLTGWLNFLCNGLEIWALDVIERLNV